MTQQIDEFLKDLTKIEMAELQQAMNYELREASKLAVDETNGFTIMFRSVMAKRYARNMERMEQLAESIGETYEQSNENRDKFIAAFVSLAVLNHQLKNGLKEINLDVGIDDI